MTERVSSAPPIHPVFFKPEYEQSEANEAADTPALSETLQEIAHITSKDYG